MCKQSDRAPSGTPSPRRSVGGGGGLMDESSLANSTIQRRSTREDCAGRLDGWTKTTKNRCTTVHDSSMEVSGAGSRGDRPTASTARSRRPTASTARPPSTALDRVEWTTGSIEGAQCATDERTDGRTDGRNGTDRPNDRPNGPNALSRAFVRAFLRPRRARERERDLRFERRSFARSFIHSFHSSSGDERASAREG